MVGFVVRGILCRLCRLLGYLRSPMKFNNAPKRRNGLASQTLVFLDGELAISGLVIERIVMVIKNGPLS